jgi:phage shock protein PspC (stress-responsive transcriptional regulator)
MPLAAQFHRIPAPEKVREATRAVLDRPEFAEPSRWHEMLFQILSAIKEWLDRLGAWSEANPALARILFIIALLLLLACLGHVLYLGLADVLPFRRRNQNAASRPARWEIFQGVATNWREALAVARAKLNEGDPRRAIWIAHRALLALLDQQGAVQFAGWKTNSHYVRECAPTHPWRATFADLTELYEEVVYASRHISTDSVEALIARVERMCSEAGSAL